MCQPGRPGPHNESQDGSSGRLGCQSTKSSGSRPPSAAATAVWGSAMASRAVATSTTTPEAPAIWPRSDSRPSDTSTMAVAPAAAATRPWP